MIQQRSFGQTKEGKEVTIFSLSNNAGMKAEVMDFGAILVNLFVPNHEGEIADVNLGYDKLSKYEENSNFFGATVGPIANRTANASFELNGKTYSLDVNDGVNNLHTHIEKGLHKCYYSAVIDEQKNSVTFTTTMQDGELGLPGNRSFHITYMVTDSNELQIIYDATTDKDTIINLTNHSYFNLAGHGAGSILEEELLLNCDSYTDIVPGAIPTGELIEVKDTPLDFTTSIAVGSRIRSRYNALRLVSGYDHNFVKNGNALELEKVAVLNDVKAKRTMEVYTDLPGIQVYTGNWIKPHLGKEGVTYKRRGGIALETQYFPNSANDSNFIKPVTTPQKPYHSVTIYKFV